MKKIITLFCSLFIFTFTATACAETKVVTVNVPDQEVMTNSAMGIDALIEIGSRLYYDSTTRIVYWWNGIEYGQSTTSPTPYYAPNGLPYRYNPETNTFEEIERELSK